MNTAMELMSKLDEVKQKLTDREYKELADGLGKMSKNEVKRYRVYLIQFGIEVVHCGHELIHISPNTKKEIAEVYLSTDMASKILAEIREHGFSEYAVIPIADFKQKIDLLLFDPDEEVGRTLNVETNTDYTITKLEEIKS